MIALSPHRPRNAAARTQEFLMIRFTNPFRRTIAATTATLTSTSTPTPASTRANGTTRAATRAGALLALASLAGTASATWSIIIVDTRTGEVAVASATCLTGLDLRNVTPVLLSGVGAATAQSFADISGENRTFIRDRLLEGTAPSDIVTGLSPFDPGHQSRQYGIVDLRSGGRAATFSGTGAGRWAGGRTGRTGDLVYAVQGNVLTGAPVVDAAVAAIENTPGDLPVKLMASMEAARAFGGDGRCSCAGPTAESCGSPPPTFTKSAHIAYMMIARAGDRDTPMGYYGAGRSPRALASGDVNADGRIDVVAANENSNDVSLWINTSINNPNLPLISKLTSLPVPIPVNTRPRDVELVDVTGDNILDLVTISFSDATIRVAPGRGDGTFNTAILSTIAAATSAPIDLATGDFNADGLLDAVVLTSTPPTIVSLAGNGTGAFTPVATFTLPSEGRAIVAGQFAGSPALDVAVAAVATNRVELLQGAADGTFTALPGGAATTRPTAIAAADFNNDGITDFAVNAESTAQIGILTNSPSGQLTITTVPVGAAARVLAPTDFQNDGRRDLFSIGANRAQRVLNTSTGFTTSSSYAYNDNIFSVSFSDAELADLDGDSDADFFAINANSEQLLIAPNLGSPRPSPPAARPGEYAQGTGTGVGDYFMNFNIANQTADAPDPVIQLRQQFDAWRNSLLRAPDAIRSQVELSRPCVGPNSTVTMTIRLRDFNGTLGNNAVRVVHAPDSARASTIGQIQFVSTGTYRVTLTTPTTNAPVGTDRFRVITNETSRAVVLMPSPELRIGLDPDFDANGSVDFFDYLDFVADFTAEEPRADFNRNGTIDFFDYLDFVQAFERGSCG
jgi:hypothetical protein